MFYHIEAIFDRSGDCSGNGLRLIQFGLKILIKLYILCTSNVFNDLSQNF